VFFGYPIAATADNWLHDCLCEILSSIHMSIGAGEDPSEWPDIIPEVRRTTLRGRHGLKSRLELYSNTFKILSATERQKVVECLGQQNQIPDLLACIVDCEKVSELPAPIQQPITDLFGFAFLLLSELGIRDKHFQIIYDADKYHVCPFCGCEYFDAPGSPREDLDHYLTKSIYPFAAANLENLVPMGMKCNERYKHDQDILWLAPGVRRTSFYPYTNRTITVRLNNSIPFGGEDGRTPSWSIEFDPNSSECQTWDEILHVRERIQRDVLDPSFMRWLSEFSTWFKRRIGDPNPSEAVVLNALQIYAEDVAFMGFNARDFLRAPVFMMLHWHCSTGNMRLSEFMYDLVTDPTVSVG
jgi:hypothetical protein